MTAPFLSEEWFTQVEEIRAGLGDQRAPLGWDVLDVNVVVTEAPVGDGNYHLSAAAGGLPSPGRRSRHLGGFPCRADQLVASVVALRLERVVPPSPRRMTRWAEVH